MKQHTPRVARCSRKSAIAAWMLLAFGTMPSFAQPSSVLLRRAEALLSRECAICHAVGRHGDSRQGLPFVEIARGSDLVAIRKSLESGITSGHPAMPKVHLSGTDIEAIMAYLRAIARP
jgi:mono/diheme cytochrome c family protein